MIITLKNFIEEAKKVKAGFKISSVKEGTIPCYLVHNLLLANNSGVPSSFIITKEELPRFAVRTHPSSREMLVQNNSELVDWYYHKTLQKLGEFNLTTFAEEIPKRSEINYTHSSFFIMAFNEYFKGKSQREQIAFQNNYNLPIMKCPITKEWESNYNQVPVFIDGIKKTISRKGFEIAALQYDSESFEGYYWFWTKDSMNFYTINGVRMSLYNILNSTNIHECPDCGSLYYGEEEICQTCHPGITVDNIYQQYSARAERVFQFKSKKEDGKKPLFLGVELELENRTSKNLLRTWKLLKDHAIIKRDGSVSEGIEICTAPATISIHKESFKEFFSEVKDLKLLAKANCGMHVHVDRATLTELQIGKMLSFMYNKENRAFLNKIAGRKDNNYCSLSGEKTVTTGIYYDQNVAGNYRQKLRRNAGGGRYTGINLTNNATIEFRIFASTVSYEEFSKNLEFVQSLVDFTKPGAVNVKTLKDFQSKDVYMNFVKENRKIYPNLFQFLKSENN